MSAPARRRGARCAWNLSACSALCAHRQFVEAYRAQRAMEEAALEAATGLWPGDVADYLERHGPLTTFRSFLEQNRGGAGPSCNPAG